MLTDFIIEQIKEKKRIIIPEFGAILSKEDSKGNITYSFSPFLKYNDGVIVNYIANKDNIAKDDAIAEIKKYIETIKSTIDKDGSFSLEGIGNIIKDNKGSFKLTEAVTAKETEKPEEKAVQKETPKAEKSSSKKDNTIESTSANEVEKSELELMEKKTTGKIKVPENTPRTKPEDKKPELTEAVPKEVKEETTKKVLNVKPKTEDKKPKAVKEEKPVAKKEPEVEIVREKKEEVKKTATKTAPNKTKEVKEPKKEAPKSKIKEPELNYRVMEPTKKSGLTPGVSIGIIVGVLIITFAALWYFNVLPFLPREKSEKAKTEKVDKAKDKKEATTNTQDEVKPEEDQEVEQINQQTEATEKENTKPEVKKVDTEIKEVSGNTNQYYIIAGSFQNKAYAKNFAKTMQGNGYQTQIIEKSDGMHAVSIFSYADYQTAMSKIKELRTQNIQVWLLKQ